MRIVMLFIVGMVVAFVIALSQVNLETLRGNILSILQNATGMPVEIDGAVSWKFSLRPRIELNQVRIPNADWAKHKYAFSAEKIDVTSRCMMRRYVWKETPMGHILFHRWRLAMPHQTMGKRSHSQNTRLRIQAWAG